MNSLNKIVVVADQITAQPALGRAVEIAKRTGAELVLLAFVHDSLGDEDAILSEKERLVYREKLIDARSAALTAELKSLAPKFRPNINVIWHKRYHEWLCENVKKLGADLVIKHARPSTKAFYMPSDWHLMRKLPVALWLVSEKSYTSGPVIASIDANDKRANQKKLDNQVLETAGFFARTLKNDLKAIYARPLPQLLFDLDLVDHRSYKKKAEVQAVDAVQKRSEAAGVHKQLKEVLIGFGDAETVIPRMLRRQKPSVLVMGTAARSGVQELLVGNTSERVIAAINIDVLILK